MDLEPTQRISGSCRGFWSSLVSLPLRVIGRLNTHTCSPTNQSDFDAIKAISAAVIQSFNESSTPPGFVQFTGTNEVIQDFEMIRKALCYEKVHFLGLS
jgi:hypothetical protein